MASRAFEIPLTNRPQDLKTRINNTVYRLVVRWNWVAQSWIMDIYDTTDVPILRGVPLITGADLLEQFAYLGIGSGVSMIVMTTAVGVPPDEVPTWDNLGTDGHLYYFLPAS